MHLHTLSLYFHTVRHLKYKQIFYRIWYFVRNIIAAPGYRPLTIKRHSETFSSILVPFPERNNIYADENCFIFLNIRHCFEDTIDWNLNEYGKLWTYNLNYFEFLSQNDIGADRNQKLIYSFIKSLGYSHTGLEPYPISLRGINFIKYLVKNNISDSFILESLYGQYYLLMRNIEFHILGNHLLENGLSLFAGGIFFNDWKLINAGKKILENEIEEQILNDGGHFERSPMYHQLILERILDVINIINCWSNSKALSDIHSILCQKSGLMLGWLDMMTIKDSSIPHFNDSTDNISLMSFTLTQYASKLNIEPTRVNLNASGYRRYIKEKYDCIVDVGNIGPDYQPGHSHSDTLSFVLYLQGQPVIVDTGISTYEADDKRLYERRTSAHNTFQLKGVEQSEVWSAFRVGRRARCQIVDETKNSIKANHNGYSFKKILAERSFYFMDDEVCVKDSLGNAAGESYLHFHPDIKIQLSGNKVNSELFDIVFENCINLKRGSYFFAEGFNKTRKAPLLSMDFYGLMNYRIIVK